MNLPVDEIKPRLGVLSKNLLDALESDDHEKALGAEQEFTKAVFRLVAGWAVNDLLNQINNAANHSDIKRQLKLITRSLTVFRPAE